MVRTLIKGDSVKSTFSIIKFHVKEEILVRIQAVAPKFLSVNAETVDSPTAVGVKGSSPLEVRKTFSMVLLEVQILLHRPV